MRSCWCCASTASRSPTTPGSPRCPTPRCPGTSTTAGWRRSTSWRCRSTAAPTSRPGRRRTRWGRGSRPSRRPGRTWPRCWAAWPSRTAARPPTWRPGSTPWTRPPWPGPAPTWPSGGPPSTGVRRRRGPGRYSTRWRRTPTRGGHGERLASAGVQGRGSTVRRAAAVLAMLLGVTAVSCRVPGELGSPGGGHGAGGGPLGAGNGYVDRHAWRASQDEYLRFATGQLTPTSPTSVLAHLARADRDPHFDFDASAIGPDDFAAVFAKIDAFQDTSDFDMMQLVALWYGHRREITPELRAAIEQRLLGFRYWFTDPLPAGVIDQKWFWSENHRIIFHTLEYLAGRALPDATFAITGHTGEATAADGRARVEAWLDEKATWGFSEWHSDVYYQEDIQALTLLTEYAERDLARRAAVMLDLFLYDLAVHQLRGNNGVTHGRSYMKDKSRATDQDVFGTTKLLFDTTSLPYPSRTDTGAVLLAASTSYRLPEVIRRVATSPQTFVDHTRMGAPIDLDQPFSTDPESAVPGVAYDDPPAVEFWWDRGALTAWQTVPITLATLDERDLFERGR